jgi:hypothetical protein
MQIEYTTKKVVEEVVRGELKLPSVNILSTDNGYEAVVHFKTNLGKTYMLRYMGKRFNSFWEDFNTFGFLFEELKKRYPETKSLVIPEGIEDLVLNPAVDNVLADKVV